MLRLLQWIAMGLVVLVAASTVGRWLAAEKLKPWRFHFQALVLEVIISEALGRGVYTLTVILGNGPGHAARRLE